MPTLMLFIIYCGLVICIIMLFHNLATLLGVCVLFTYLLLPLVNGLEDWIKRLSGSPLPHKRLRLPRALLGTSVPVLSPRLMAVIIIYTVMGLGLALAITVLLPVVTAQTDDLFRALPHYGLQIRQLLLRVIPSLPPLPFTELSWSAWVNHLTSQWISSGAGPLALTRFSEWSVQGLRAIVAILSGFSIIFYLLLDGKQRAEGVMHWLPSDKWRNLFTECHAMLFRFIKGQVLLAVISGALMMTLYALFGVEHAVILGLVFTVAEIFPVIGPWFAFAPGIVVMLFSDNPWTLVYVLGIYFLLKDNIILPKVVGQVMGIHPIWIIVSLLIAAKVGGAVGVIFAVPLSAILGVIWAHYQRSRLITVHPA